MARRIRSSRGNVAGASLVRFTLATLSSIAFGAAAGCGGDTLDLSTYFVDASADQSAPDGSANDSGNDCTDVLTDAKNCGACGNACSATEACVAGKCTATTSCPNGQMTCDGACVDTATSATHCGSCTNDCGANTVCSAGTCSGCVSGFSACGGTDAGLEGGSCVDEMSDPANCGGCGVACPAGNVCTNGTCALSCATGQLVCASNASGDGGAADAASAGDASRASICVSPASDVNNCGGCGITCTSGAEVATPSCTSAGCVVGTCSTGFADCNMRVGDGCEVNTETDVANCGTCGTSCATGQTCSGGVCHDFGTGADGALNVAILTTTAINSVETPVTSGTAGGSTATVASATGIATGNVVLLVQMQGVAGTAPAAGDYEKNQVASINGTTITFVNPLAHGYGTGVGTAAQLVVVPQYTSVTVMGTLTAPAWNGSTGGILAFESNATTSIVGAVDMSAKGFRGTSHALACTSGAHVKDDCTNGFQGESSSGVGTASLASNGSGGGGGGKGQDCGEGAGGGYATTGANGGAAKPATTPTVCGAAIAASGMGGDVSGAANLGASILLGGAGGEGGADEDGVYPGAGGNGGGIVWIAAESFNMGPLFGGSIRVSGGAGANGVNTGVACGLTAGTGSGEGGGGGGAGGAVRIVALTAALGTNNITAAGSAGGMCATTGTIPSGGTGGAGRIGVAAPTITGTTSPTYDPE